MPAKLFLLFFVVCGVFGNRGKNVDATEKKKTFLKIVDLTRHNQVDSLREYLPDQYEEDSFYFTTNISNARALLSASNSPVSMDSIKLTDSTFAADANSEIYYYRLTRYRDSTYTGAITIGFYGHTSDQACFLSTDYVPDDGSAEMMQMLNKYLPK